MHFQSYAFGLNHWDCDPDLRHVLALYWPGYAEHEAELCRFGALAGREVYEVGYHVDHEAAPVLVMHDLDGNRVDRLRLSPAHASLLGKLARPAVIKPTLDAFEALVGADAPELVATGA